MNAMAAPGSQARPLVTVLLPVFNGETYLAAAIESVLGQTYANFELLVMDDGSTDGSGQVIARYRDPRLVAVRNERNLGLVATLNKGIALARGELIARIDADDVADSRRFELQVDRFERDPGLVALGTGIRYIDAAGRVVAVPPRQAQGRYFLRWRVLRGTCLYHPTLMLHRARAGADAYYSGDFVHAEDYELLLRLSRSRALDNLAEPLVALRQHEASVSRQFRSEQRSSAARALVLHVRQLYALDLPVGVAEALIDPRHLFGGSQCSLAAPVAALLELEKRFLQAETKLRGEDRVLVNRDVAFMLWKFIAIAATDLHGGASLRQRFATLVASFAALLQRPGAAVAVFGSRPGPPIC